MIDFLMNQHPMVLVLELALLFTLIILMLGHVTFLLIDSRKSTLSYYIKREEEKIYFPMFDKDGMTLVKDVKIKRLEEE